MLPQIHWNLISLELLITLTLVVLMVLDAILPKTERKDWLGMISFGAILGMIGFWVTQRSLTGTTLSGMFTMDPLAWFFKAFFLFTMVFIFVMAQQFSKIFGNRRNEFYLLLWVALLGMSLIASAADFLVLFIALEILTISLYVMTAYLKSDKLSIEAGMKYLVLGSLASGFFLYGISFLYGATHSTRFDAIQAYAGGHTMAPMMLFGLIMIFSAVAFKIAAVPFHMWVPDVYQGAPAPVTALLSVGSKAAGFLILMRMFSPGGIFTAWQFEWSLVLAALAAITMTYGNLVAIFQTNIKRLLGYSSISHAGYLLMGAAAGTMLGAAGMNFYLLGYLFTNLTVFLVIILFSLTAKSDEIADYAGLSKRSPILAASLTIALISLAGMPPLAGFFGKFTLLLATVQSGFLWLALIASVNIVISLYYYLILVKRIYIDAPGSTDKIPVSIAMRGALILSLFAIVIIGFFQGPFFAESLTAVKSTSLLQP